VNGYSLSYPVSVYKKSAKVLFSVLAITVLYFAAGPFSVIGGAFDVVSEKSVESLQDLAKLSHVGVGVWVDWL
jgi:hypothetical protein